MQNNTGCKGYWVEMVYVGDPLHPTAYKCMDQQEYDNYTQQVAQQQGANDPWAALIGLAIPLVIIGVVLLSVFVIPKIGRLRRGKKA